MIKRICPVLNVKNAKLARDFYVQHMGFSVFFDYDTYICVKRDEAEIHLSEVPQEECHPAGAYFYVTNVNELHQEFTCKKGVIIDQPWGMREFITRDCDGNDLRFGQDLDIENE